MGADAKARKRSVPVAAAALAAAALAAGPAVADPPTTLVPPPAAHTFGIRRLTQRELTLVMPGVALVSPGGLAVTRLAATDDPDDRSDDDEVTVVGVDTGAGALFTTFGLAKVGRFDGKGTEFGPLSRPDDVAIDRTGLVAVTDTGNRRVVILRHDGTRLEPVVAHGGFLEPRGIAADGRGGFLVCDRRFHAVFRLDALTGARSTFGLEAAFDRPVDVATIPEGDRMASGKKRVVVVADRDGARLRSFDPAGALRAARNASSLGGDGASFDAVDVDYRGNVFAVDRAGNRLHKLGEDLAPLATFGSRGTGPGQFLGPRAIAIYRRFGQVFLSEEDGGQYLWIGTDVLDLSARADGTGVRLEYALTEESTVDVRILDAGGGEVVRLVEGARVAPGRQNGFWDGTNGAASRVDPGEYVVEVRARATYASRSSFECRRSTPFTLPRGEAR
jgi:hypothetical protein